MKIIYRQAACCILIIAMASCSKNDKLSLQPHDQDKMMSLMHQMMSKMDTMHITGDPEIDFVTMMATHHQGAIDRAMLELREGKEDSLKRTAQKIIDEQKKEIEEFSTYLSTHSIDNSEPEFDSMQNKNMLEMSKTADVQLITSNIDNDFATLMIIHHQAAVNNAAAYLQYGNDPELENKAHGIINSQRMEIIEMSDWLIANNR